MQIKQTVENRRSYKKIRHISVGETYNKGMVFVFHIQIPQK
jgi:hypothetical protein